MKKLFILAIASFLVTTTAFSMSHKKQDILDVASKAGSSNTLIAAAKAGADYIVTGTITEEFEDLQLLKERLNSLISVL